ncbi:STN and carboxypeptidase regulatory-like domain-containing protein [Mucilaginibacter sp. 22184]|uniref:STN and carboxypeptidase regulatory-like domain-containing protein n=1 Tax=Mucilaginibacter sp. 22184 TaxID=3453887 RepID=UPI003F828E3F
MDSLRRHVLLFLIIFTLPLVSRATEGESILAKNISVHVSNMRLGSVLKTIEQKGNFTFSYNSNIVKTDSLVTLNVNNWTIKEVLDQMLLNRFEYKETRNFVILRYAPLQLSLTTEKAITEDGEYNISGFVTDDRSGKKLENASVYERSLLQSTLTGKDGRFELHLKNNGKPVILTVSKEYYRDTTVTFLSGVTVNSNQSQLDEDGYMISNDDDGIERTVLGRLFTSARQKVRATNLHGLIAQAPFQASAIPGVSTHAEFSGQVVNAVSLNAVGGYNAGVDGFELGLIFNLDKGDVGAVQIAGIFNVVGGNVNGIQVGGLYNNVLGSVRGIQLSLLHNRVKRDLNGIQVAGLYNHTRGSVRGIQLAALGNIAGQKYSGMQIAGLFNYTHNLRGVQLGLINVADTSSGYSIGLINIVRYGYHKLALSSNETLNANIGLKTGSKNLYTIWTGGLRVNDNSKLYAFGFGFGREMGMGKHLAFNPEITEQYVYQGNWARTNLLGRLDASLTYHVAKAFSINAGPSLNLFYSDQRNAVNGYAYVKDLHHSFINNSNSWTGWVGWTVGVSFF